MDTGFNCLPSKPSPAQALGQENAIASFSKIYNYTSLPGDGCEELPEQGGRAQDRRTSKRRDGFYVPNSAGMLTGDGGDGLGIWREGHGAEDRKKGRGSKV